MEKKKAVEEKAKAAKAAREAAAAMSEFQSIAPSIPPTSSLHYVPPPNTTGKKIDS